MNSSKFGQRKNTGYPVFLWLVSRYECLTLPTELNRRLPFQYGTLRIDVKKFSSPLEKAFPKTRLYLFLRTSTFVGIQAPVPEFEGNNKENKGNQNQTTDIKECILILQEVASWIISREGKRHDEAN